MDLQALESLIALLEQEEAIYDEMGFVLDEEHSALLGMAAARVAALAARKETLGLRIKALDESRKLLARRLAQALGLEPSQVTVIALCQAAPRAAAERLRAAGDRLKATVLRCQEVSRHNALAAGRGAELIKGLIEHLIQNADPAGKVYQAPRGKGYAAPARGSAGFISRQA